MRTCHRCSAETHVTFKTVAPGHSNRSLVVRGPVSSAFSCSMHIRSCMVSPDALNACLSRDSRVEQAHLSRRMETPHSGTPRMQAMLPPPFDYISSTLLWIVSPHSWYPHLASLCLPRILPRGIDFRGQPTIAPFQALGPFAPSSAQQRRPGRSLPSSWLDTTSKHKM